MKPPIPPVPPAPPAIDPRGDELRKAVDDQQLELDSAVEALGRVASSELSVGGQFARHPWQWMAVACIAGFALALVSSRSEGERSQGGRRGRRD